MPLCRSMNGRETVSPGVPQWSRLKGHSLLTGVGGALGSPGMRSSDRNRGCNYPDNNRDDSFLPTVWPALGTGEPRFDFSRSDDLKPAGDGCGNGCRSSVQSDTPCRRGTLHADVTSPALSRYRFQSVPRGSWFQPVRQFTPGDFVWLKTILSIQGRRSTLSLCGHCWLTRPACHPD